MSEVPIKKTKLNDDDREAEKEEDEPLTPEQQSKLDLALLEACKANGSLVEIRGLIEEGADATFQEEKTGASGLMLTAAHGNCDVITYLLKEGAVWNALDRKHKCAGDYATDAGHQDAVDAILQHAVICELILGRAKSHAEKDEKAKKEKMDAQGFGDNHEYLRSKLKYDKNDVEGLLLGKFKNELN